MSAFAVFGMTASHAYQQAKKNTKPQWLKDEQRFELPDEFEQRVRLKAERIMSGERVSQISQLYDAPQYCRDFMELAGRAGESRSLQVRRRDQIEVTKGQKIIKRTVWHEYII